MIVTFNLIGSGRLGMSLAQALLTEAQLQLLAVCNQHTVTAQKCVQTLQEGQVFLSVADLPAADLVVITTPDDRIVTVTKALMAQPMLHPGTVVIHCSGVHTSALLAPLRQRGCLVASVHPFKSFASTKPQSLLNCPCVIEGDAEAVAQLSTLFGQLGAKVICLSAVNKHVYHAAATMASNYLVTLAASATALLINAGIEHQQAKQMCEQLMVNTLNNIQHSDEVSQALTGPLVRQDVQTIHHHLQAINTPLIEGLYRAAGLATLPFINTSEDVLNQLTSLLTNT